MSSALMSISDDINEVVRKRFQIGSAADEPVEITVSGIVYVFKPHEVLDISDRLDYQRNDKGNPIVGRPLKVREGGDAFTIVHTIFSSSVSFDGHNKGLYLVRNDGRDAERRANARVRYVAGRVERAKETQRRWLRQLDKVKPGDLPPVQPRSVRKDLEFLAQYEAGTIDRKAFIAFDGGAESDNRVEVESYIRSRYPGALEAGKRPDGREGVLIISRDVVVPRPTVPPPPTPAVVAAAAQAVDVAQARAEDAPAASQGMEDVQFLIDEAKALGASLTPEEALALATRDQLGLEALMDRLATLKAATVKE